MRKSTAKSRPNTRQLTAIAMMSAFSIILSLPFLQFPMPLFPSFLKIDFADLPALIGGFILGPAAGIAIELVKNIIGLFWTQTAGIGELANFLVGGALVGVAGGIYRAMKRKNRTRALFCLIAGIIAMAAMGALANWLLILPFYAHLMPMDAIIALCRAIIPAVHNIAGVVFYTIIPFNLFKGVIIGAITFLTYNKLTPLLRM